MLIIVLALSGLPVPQEIARMRGGGMKSCCAAWQGKVAAVCGCVPCELLADLPAVTPRFWCDHCSALETHSR